MLRSTAPTSIQSQLSAPSSPTLSSSCSWLEPSHSHFKAFPQFFYLERCFLLLASSFLVDRVQFKWNVLQGASSDHLVRGSHLPIPTGLTWLNYLHLLGLCSLRWWKGQWFSLHLVTWGLNEITWNEGFEHCLDKINTKKKNAIMIFHHQFMSLSSCRIEPCLVASSFIFKVHHPDLYFCPHTSSFTSLTFSPLP